MDKKEIVLDFYGKDLADYKKFKIILEEIKNLPGCENANPYIKEGVTFAGYSSMMVEWAIENKEFLLALAMFLYQLLKDLSDPYDKIVVNNSIIVSSKDNLDSISKKLERFK